MQWDNSRRQDTAWDVPATPDMALFYANARRDLRERKLEVISETGQEAFSQYMDIFKKSEVLIKDAQERSTSSIQNLAEGCNSHVSRTAKVLLEEKMTVFDKDEQELKRLAESLPAQLYGKFERYVFHSIWLRTMRPI